jgi:putative colanic acid biosynthesis acetyltransferase WcaF
VESRRVYCSQDRLTRKATHASSSRGIEKPFVRAKDQNPPAFSVDLTKSNQSWDLKIKIKRVLWTYAQLFIFRFTPRRLGNPFRIFLLRKFGAKIKGTPLVDPSCKILLPWELEIGEFSAIGHHVEIYNYGRVTIGPMSVVSQYSYLCTGSHDYTHPHMPLIWEPITIGAECWVAAGVFVAPGVVINDGVVVGACSVVTKDLPPWTVCAGNPCKVIRERVIKSSIAKFSTSAVQDML